MNLKSGCIFWTRVDGALSTYSPLGDDLTCEVAIVGGGMTGALAAYHLSQTGVSTVLLDRREICHGSTAASTGLLQYEIDTPLRDLARKVGEAHAAAAYLACLRSLDAFRQIVEDLDDHADLTGKTSLYVASHERDVDELREEWAARRASGIDVQFLSAGAISERFSFRRPAALYSTSALEADPYRLAHALLRRSVQRGLRAFSQTEVVRYLPDSGGVTLVTRGGPRVRAKKIVFATGYETPQVYGNVRTRLRSTYAIASAPLDRFDGWHEHCLIWETARPYFYLRTTADGRAMMGGGDEDVVDDESRDRLIPAKSRELAARFRAMFPEIDMQPECAWAGTFAETQDGLPLIGSCPDFPHGYFALGYGGNGITFSLIAAEIIRDRYLGKPNANANLFRFNR
jgi:glycine/D-amino acid oxidase-like deaminating enzyme